jgi:hypothetical protein
MLLVVAGLLNGWNTPYKSGCERDKHNPGVLNPLNNKYASQLQVTIEPESARRAVAKLSVTRTLLDSNNVPTTDHAVTQAASGGAVTTIDLETHGDRYTVTAQDACDGVLASKTVESGLRHPDGKGSFIKGLLDRMELEGPDALPVTLTITTQPSCEPSPSPSPTPAPTVAPTPTAAPTAAPTPPIAIGGGGGGAPAATTPTTSASAAPAVQEGAELANDATWP